MDYYISTDDRKRAIQETCDAYRNGFYVRDGQKVAFPSQDYRRCEYVTQMPEQAERPAQGSVPSYDVVPMDSFEALSLTEHPQNAAVLNFACATVPGGGFLSGHKAQEECLCLQSTLHASLTSDDAQQYYADNKSCSEKLRPVRMLYSPEVWVFRNPDLTYRDPAVRTQVATLAAPNVKAGAKGVSAAKRRTYFEDSVRLMCGYIAGKADTLILGAWGCGAFGNDPKMVADCFRNVLVKEGFETAFARIIFAVRKFSAKDDVSQNFEVFQAAFSEDALAAVRPAARSPFTKGGTVYIVEKAGVTRQNKWYHY